MIVLDTHALVWWVAEPARLSARARRQIATAAAEKRVAASAISLFEIATLVRRGRLALSTDIAAWLGAVKTLPELAIEPVSAEIAERAGAFPDELPGDPADRLIAATALALNARLVTADERLRHASPVATIW